MSLYSVNIFLLYTLHNAIKMFAWKFHYVNWVRTTFFQISHTNIKDLTGKYVLTASGCPWISDSILLFMCLLDWIAPEKHLCASFFFCCF